MKRASRVDSNHAEIANAARGLGCSVEDLHRVGHGCPDLLVGVPGSPALNLLVEVKSDAPYRPGEGGAKRGELNGEQEKWHAVWLGQKCVVRDVEELGAVIKAARILQEFYRDLVG